MDALVEILVTAVCAFILGAILCGGCCIRAIHEEAVEAGVAEFYIDAGHDKAFRWKTNGIPMKEAK